MGNCLFCNTEIKDIPNKRRYRKDKKFCNQKCHDDFKSAYTSKTAKKFKEDFGLNKYAFKGLLKKLDLIELFGGKCEKCGYDKNIAGFDFHHIDPYTKAFEIKAHFLNYKTDDVILEEALKCMLLCSNCHRELHNPALDINHIRTVLKVLNK
jgi:hypothetical protein